MRPPMAMRFRPARRRDADAPAVIGRGMMRIREALVPIVAHLPITWIRPGSAPGFPPPARALREPNGLLAFDGDLSLRRLVAAYRHGIFPWFGPDEPILWWSPDPRCVFTTRTLRPARTLRRQMRRVDWTITMDRAFREVMLSCAAPRPGQHGGTWITPPMVAAYTALHRAGHAHSIEVWHGTRLVGGLYGVAVGRMFCGESMFSAASGGSKVALACLGQLLERWGFPLLDAQVGNPHLYLMGASDLPRAEFIRQLMVLVRQTPTDEAFRLPPDGIPVAGFA